MNIFITGGTGGIGKGLVEHYLKLGHRVGICGGSQEDFQNSYNSVNYEISKLFFYDLDVTDRDKVNKVFTEFSKDLNLDLLICCAGINNNKPHSSLEIDFEREHLILNINLQGTFNCFTEAIKIMKKFNSGHIVGISSAAGLIGLPGAPAYCASKSAIITLCQSLYVRLKPLNIFVTAVAPGYIDTPLARASVPGIENKKSTLTIKQATEEIVRAIDNKKLLHIFPFQLKLTSIIIKLIPLKLFYFVVAKIYMKQIK